MTRSDAADLWPPVSVEEPDAVWERPPSAVRRSEAPLHHCRQTKFTRNLSLPLPMLDAKVFLKLLQLDLNAHPPGAPIVKIHLSAEPARHSPIDLQSDIAR